MSHRDVVSDSFLSQKQRPCDSYKQHVQDRPGQDAQQGIAAEPLHDDDAEAGGQLRQAVGSCLEGNVPEDIREELVACAQMVSRLDDRMLLLNQEVQSLGLNDDK